MGGVGESTASLSSPEKIFGNYCRLSGKSWRFKGVEVASQYLYIVYVYLTLPPFSLNIITTIYLKMLMRMIYHQISLIYIDNISIIYIILRKIFFSRICDVFNMLHHNII